MAMSPCVLRSTSLVLHLRHRFEDSVTPRARAGARPHTVVRVRDYWIYAAAPAA
jgi:hypothetical protein